MANISGRALRRNVGILIVHPQTHKILAGQCNQSDYQYWQAPQGGILEGEMPLTAAYRELYEETGLQKDNVVQIAEHDQWLTYTYDNAHTRPHPEDGIIYNGQTQKWFLFMFTGQEDSINLTIESPQTFSSWMWMPIDTLATKVAPYKADIYRHLARWLKTAIV